MDEQPKTEGVKQVTATAAGDPKPEESVPAQTQPQQSPPSAPPPAAPAQPSVPAPAQQKKSFFKQKGFLIGLIILLVVGVGGGVFAFVSSSKAPAEEETVDNSLVVETLTAEQLGLTMEAKPDKKAVKFKIEKAGDIKTIEYQVTYEADSTAQERAEGGEERVQRGITGESDVKGSDLTYESEWLDLGSCSRNVCRYDSGVETVELTLKIVKKNGKTYEAQDSLELNSAN